MTTYEEFHATLPGHKAVSPPQLPAEARGGLGVVLGGAECVWEDLVALQAMAPTEGATIVCVNDAGWYWPGHFDFWATMHPEELLDRMVRRADLGYPSGYTTVGRSYPYGLKERETAADYLLDGWDGSSGLLAVGVALHVGCERVVLCGVPMDNRPHFNRDGGWEQAEKYRQGWLDRRADLANVRSMGGWTADLLGTPTREWLDG